MDQTSTTQPNPDEQVGRGAAITPEFATEHTLTPGDVAAIFNVRPKTVSRWADAGELPCITTPGGHRRFRQRDVAALLNEASERPDR